MTVLVTIFHVVVCTLLIAIILMQSGRGGGLTDAFSSAENVFGAKTNEFMIKSTAILSTLFIVGCLGLAIMNTKKDKSLMTDISKKSALNKNKVAKETVNPEKEDAKNTLDVQTNTTSK